MSILKNSHVGTYYWGLSSFWTLTIVQYSQEYNLSETGCFCLQVKGWKEPGLFCMKQLISITENGTYNENNKEGLMFWKNPHILQ
jgi:hypothetical protein